MKARNVFIVLSMAFFLVGLPALGLACGCGAMFAK